MDVTGFQELIAELTEKINGEPLDANLEARLNDEFGPGSPLYEAIFNACIKGTEEGWMCNREAAGIRYGRVLKASDATHGFSVDVVDMDNVIGPHHAHPNGEIDMIMPLTKDAAFDSRPAGWCVYGPGSAHHPTVTQGRALVLYLLPQGAIQFTPAGAN
ncbi:protein of unknown function [Noviherbaspirillum humi]|uniref:2-hydroxylaminobenzoate mutase n=1 Tax=Noviherbaspirillum humi TaxID=1688639 RepID=A0A239K536_9BURK|nr:DUF4863 family protein [Noviherbaspirillum humi]SNT12234.1 protein of unknown function [Noviherbaspirillum humi]